MEHREGDIPELLRSHGKGAIYALAASVGIKKTSDGRIQCPFDGCRDKGPDRSTNVQIFASGAKFKLHCHSCGFSGDFLDMLEAVNRWSKAEAIAHLRGLPAPAPRPNLRIVAPGKAEDPDKGKLLPAEVDRLWKSLAEQHDGIEAYLESRGLQASSLVRFVPEDAKDEVLKRPLRSGHRVAMLLTDVAGQARGIQLRLARAALEGEDKQKSVQGSKTSGAFFGRPELIESSALVHVAEGMFDTLALQAWAGPEATVVGAAGMTQLFRLAEALKASGVPLDGKIFALYPQNDRPKNRSRNNFKKLAQLLAELGAHLVWCNTHEEYKDLADWRQDKPDLEWPPVELRRALVGEREPGDESEPEMVQPQGSALPMQARYTTNHYGQDNTTLLALLDDPVHRESTIGRGEIVLSEMTNGVLLNGRELGPDDYTNLSIRLEQVGQEISGAGRRLKFARQSIEDAVHFLATRKRVHPLRDWISALRWDGILRLDTGLCDAFGQTRGELPAHLLRKWFLCAAARGLMPGCKMETVLVIAGPQGCGKTRFCEAMGGAWFTNNKVRVDDDNGKRLMRRAWIVEWGELDSMRRAKDQESIKAFLSLSIDSWRPLHKEQLVDAPRHSVIVGTTNETQFLHDPTGSRRFWPVVVKSIDVAWVAANREQLVAEAVAAVRGGEQWHLDAEMEKVLTDANREHQGEDAIAPIIRDWLTGRLQFEVTVTEVMGGALGMDAEQISRAGSLGSRIGGVLQQLGWKSIRPRSRDGARLRVWVKEDA